MPALREIVPLFVRSVPGPASLYNLVREAQNPDASPPDLVPQHQAVVQTLRTVLLGSYDWAPQGPRAMHPSVEELYQPIQKLEKQLNKILSGEKDEEKSEGAPGK